MLDYATLVRVRIEAVREVGRRKNVASQRSKENNRLAAALEFDPGRVIRRTLVGELAWFNARTKQHTLFELFHEVSDGEGKFTVYANGDRWRNGWSVSRFCRWLGGRIDRVRVSWD